MPMPHMLLQLRCPAAQEQALTTLIDQRHDPNSPNYHQWLSAEQLGAQFGPAASDVWYPGFELSRRLFDHGQSRQLRPQRQWRRRRSDPRREYASAGAPGAAIVIASCLDLLLAINNVVNGANPPPIMSISYGFCESGIGAVGSSLLRGNAIGIRATGGASLVGYGNNHVTGNASNGSFTGTAGLQ
jgi:Pro-kumamolisin, activation domain